MLKAIETHYKGYHFRSRLEARWAVFFDALGVPWEYEKEGYDLGDAGWYLPDFWLPTVYDRIGRQGLWVEIKGQEPTAEEDARCERLAIGTRQSVNLFVGSPLLPEYGANGFQWTIDPGGVTWDNGMAFHYCLACRAVKVEFANDYFSCPACKAAESCQHSCIKMEYAVTCAKSARFEHGK